GFRHVGGSFGLSYLPLLPTGITPDTGGSLAPLLASCSDASIVGQLPTSIPNKGQIGAWISGTRRSGSGRVGTRAPAGAVRRAPAARAPPATPRRTTRRSAHPRP